LRDLAPAFSLRAEPCGLVAPLLAIAILEPSGLSDAENVQMDFPRSTRAVRFPTPFFNASEAWAR